MPKSKKQTMRDIISQDASVTKEALMNVLAPRCASTKFKLGTREFYVTERGVTAISELSQWLAEEGVYLTCLTPYLDPPVIAFFVNDEQVVRDSITLSGVEYD